MEIKIKQREIYGIIKFYPACKISQGLVKLLGQKVLTIDNINKLQSIGFKITKGPYSDWETDRKSVV